MLTSKPIIACVVIVVSVASIGCSSNSETSSAFTVVNQTVVVHDLTSRTVGKIELAGQWESTAFGHQTLTTRPDGTATISMILSPFAIPIYGRKINLDLEWTLKGQYLTQHIVGGSPERSVKKLIQKYGDTHEYLLVEHDANHLLVKETTGAGAPVRWTAAEPHL